MTIERQDLVVLIAEDDPSLADLLSRGLKNSGLRTDPICTRGGKKALEIIGSQPVNLILTAGYMPEMDGPELIAALRGQNFAGQIIAMTAGGVSEDKFRELGIPTLHKPYKMEELPALINQLFPTP